MMIWKGAINTFCELCSHLYLDKEVNMNDISDDLTNFVNEYVNSNKIISKLLRYSSEPLGIMF